VIASHGYEVVVNLALPTSDHAISHEGSLVTQLGMRYVHLPVPFDAPNDRYFDEFCAIMRAFAWRKLFVHCAANKRVSAFLYLHRVLLEGVSPSEAEQDLLAIWQPDPVWASFIQSQLARRVCKSSG
jgi:protein tyrosine phosphatase (PTP) superfamily phosphohydrolase (DUF442 family)